MSICANDTGHFARHMNGLELVENIFKVKLKYEINPVGEFHEFIG
jgi:hypothetical protein